MRRLVFSSGRGNSILRSIRPGRIRAGSKVSIRAYNAQKRSRRLVSDCLCQKCFASSGWSI
ncbi:hypothetical protein FF38_12596 [Lucilia cuprina]|uniref:Uncharacterized protein n=1 Tax=Lucilia cuprina TaxID=7375 RepID=A0A0L0BN23_LUCCU|nr:hypothetical protein FF38_12596 [Lucilia cuprina]